MKKNNIGPALALIWFLLILSGTITLRADEAAAPAYPIPEFKNKPAYYDAATNALVALEKSNYQVVTKLKALGFGGGKAGYFLEGTASRIRINKANGLSFILKVTPGEDPEALFDLAKFTIADGKRILITTKAGMFSSSGSTYTKYPYSVTKIAEGVYLLKSDDLEPGEYFLGSSEFMFAFGVDAAIESAPAEKSEPVKEPAKEPVKESVKEPVKP